MHAKAANSDQVFLGEAEVIFMQFLVAADIRPSRPDPREDLAHPAWAGRAPDGRVIFFFFTGQDQPQGRHANSVTARTKRQKMI